MLRSAKFLIFRRHGVLDWAIGQNLLSIKSIYYNVTTKCGGIWKLFAMKGFHRNPGGSQRAFLTGLAHLYNLIPYQR